jgi:tetratricopeptide (TPR) repeat protein
MVLLSLRPAAVLVLTIFVAAATAAEPAAKKPGRLEVKHVGADDEVTVETPAADSPAPTDGAPAAKPGNTGSTESSAPGQAAAASPAWKKSKLVPFPEDEPQPPVQKAATPAASKTVAQSAPTGKFQPRFRPPGVKQAQHTESAQPAESGVKQVQHVEPTAGSAKKKDPAEQATGEDIAPAELKPSEDVKPLAESPESSSQPSADASAEVSTGDLSTARGIVDHAFAKSKTAASDADFSEVIDLCRRGLHGELSKGYEEYARRLMGWAYNRRGEERAKEGRDKEALADFEAAVEAGGSWRAIHNRGVSYAAVGRYQQAMIDFDKAIQLNGRYPNAYFNRGELKFQQGDLTGAVDDYTQALQLAPDAAMFNSRGYALYRLERFGEALRDYGEAIKLDPENAAALINRADTYSDLGQYGDAARDYRAAVKLAPTLGRAYQSTAWFMATCPDTHYRNDQLAIDAARKAIELDGADYRNLSTLAAAQASAGLFDEAKVTQEKAIAKAPQPQKVTAEKMMALYQRDVAYRETPRTAYDMPENEQEKTLLQASGDMLRNSTTGRFPVRQAGATAPAGPRGRPAPRGR